VPSEAVFSFASQIITKRRNRLSADTVRYIMCLHDWGPSEVPKWMEEVEEFAEARGDGTGGAGGTANGADGGLVDGAGGMADEICLSTGSLESSGAGEE
jgi:hypothetical protein